MTQTKKQGGLGIREARSNNEAMLSKVVWKTLRGERTIWMDLIQTKYLNGSSVLHYISKPEDSPMRKGVTRCTQRLQSSFRWQICDGSKILFWFDSWFQEKELWKEVNYIDRRDNLTTLNQVLKSDGTWNFSVLYM